VIRIPLMFGIGFVTWFLCILIAIMTGQYQLACEIFLYGTLAGWALMTLWGGVLDKRRRQSAYGANYASHFEGSSTPAVSLHKNDFGRLLGVTVAVSCIVGLIVACVATGNMLAAAAIALSAAAGAFAVIWGSPVP